MKAHLVKQPSGLITIELEAESRQEGDDLLSSTGFVAQQLAHGPRYEQRGGGVSTPAALRILPKFGAEKTMETLRAMVAEDWARLTAPSEKAADRLKMARTLEESITSTMAGLEARAAAGTPSEELVDLICRLRSQAAHAQLERLRALVQSDLATAGLLTIKMSPSAWAELEEALGVPDAKPEYLVATDGPSVTAADAPADGSSIAEQVAKHLEQNLERYFGRKAEAPAAGSNTAAPTWASLAKTHPPDPDKQPTLVSVYPDGTYDIKPGRCGTGVAVRKMPKPGQQ